MSFLVPPHAVARPRSALSDSPLRRLEQIKALHDSGVITSGQMLELINEAPKCPHGIRRDDCYHVDCTVDWVHDL